MKAYRFSHESQLNPPRHLLDIEARPGRWNSRVASIAYAAEHPALGALEMLGGWATYPSLSGYHLLIAEFPDELVEDATQVNPHERAEAEAFGDAWYQEQRSLVLRVRSVVIPHGHNLIIHARHPEFHQVTVQDEGPFEYDARTQQMIAAARATLDDPGG